MNITYGCECFDKNCLNHSSSNDAPCAFIVKRNGKEIKVCTRCDMTGDEYIARLFDENTDAQVFIEYDPLGFICVARLVDDNEWKEYQTRRNLLIG